MLEFVMRLGGDYKRTERMRTVLEAVFGKVKKMNAGELYKLLNTLLPKIYTNIDSNEIISLIPEVAKYNIVKSEGWPYNVKGITTDRWYAVPVTLEENVKNLHKTLFDEEYECSETVKEISNKIIKKTNYK